MTQNLKNMIGSSGHRFPESNKWVAVKQMGKDCSFSPVLGSLQARRTRTFHWEEQSGSSRPHLHGFELLSGAPAEFCWNRLWDPHVAPDNLSCSLRTHSEFCGAAAEAWKNRAWLYSCIMDTSSIIIQREGGWKATLNNVSISLETHKSMGVQNEKPKILTAPAVLYIEFCQGTIFYV